MNLSTFNQERIVLIATVLVLIFAAIALPGFLNVNNLISIVRSISVLGILALGMGIVIIGRGIDLSMVAVMAMSVAWYLQMLHTGYGETTALLLVLAAVVFIGVLNGFLVAYADVPPIFVTLATGLFVFGFVRSQLIPSDAVTVPAGHWLETVGAARYAGIPIDVFVFLVLAFVTFVFLRFTKWGRYVYYAGDNPVAARNIGIPVRPMLVLRYVLSALFSFIAGMLTAASLLSIQTRVINSNLL
ncbi:MAG TPA: ABC transporter permease, partial [Rhodobacteraceae bacterium]|nr:ABC transporter permease [Paracoccaceae bacterium]